MQFPQQNITRKDGLVEIPSREEDKLAVNPSKNTTAESSQEKHELSDAPVECLSSPEVAVKEDRAASAEWENFKIGGGDSNIEGGA